MTVYLDGVLLTVVDPSADTTAHRQVLWRTDLTAGEHVLRVVVGDDTVARTVSVDEPARVGYLDAVAIT